jgi:AcrR family transcriptional regulator
MRRQTQGRRGRPRKIADAEEILPVALRVFAEAGYAAARLEDIARLAGLSKAALYGYYASKEAIFEALVRSAVVPNIERLERLVAGWRGSAADLLRRFFATLAQAATTTDLAAFPKLIIAEASNFPHLADFYRRAVIERGLAVLARIVRRGIRRGEFRPVDPAAAARLCIAPVLFAMIWRTCFHRAEDGPFDPQALLALQVEIVIKGLA